MYLLSFTEIICCVRKVIPVEQGLRQCEKSREIVCFLHVRKVIPVEQGLRPSSTVGTACISDSVRKVIPVEQGLRLTHFHLHLHS